MLDQPCATEEAREWMRPCSFSTTKEQRRLQYDIELSASSMPDATLLCSRTGASWNQKGFSRSGPNRMSAHTVIWPEADQQNPLSVQALRFLNPQSCRERVLSTTALGMLQPAWCDRPDQRLGPSAGHGAGRCSCTCHRCRGTLRLTCSDRRTC